MPFVAALAHHQLTAGQSYRRDHERLDSSGNAEVQVMRGQIIYNHNHIA